MGLVLSHFLNTFSDNICCKLYCLRASLYPAIMSLYLPLYVCMSILFFKSTAARTGTGFIYSRDFHGSDDLVD